MNNWIHNVINNFTVKDYLFGSVKIIRKAHERKFTNNVWGTTFDGKGF